MQKGFKTALHSVHTTGAYGSTGISGIGFTGVHTAPKGSTTRVASIRELGHASRTGARPRASRAPRSPSPPPRARGEPRGQGPARPARGERARGDDAKRVRTMRSRARRMRARCDGRRGARQSFSENAQARREPNFCCWNRARRSSSARNEYSQYYVNAVAVSVSVSCVSPPSPPSPRAPPSVSTRRSVKVEAPVPVRPPADSPERLPETETPPAARALYTRGFPILRDCPPPRLEPPRPLPPRRTAPPPPPPPRPRDPPAPPCMRDDAVLHEEGLVPRHRLAHAPPAAYVGIANARNGSVHPRDHAGGET